ncbi:hypothetical protein ACFVUY_36995 [Kitasatospora sp. NPDC058063]|uniref:hypothetical protein n=1 Tax=unclassified Kitasatospora TaxID=2633591 RepID=UPI0036D891F5
MARAILCRPRVLLLDEPTAGLDRPAAEGLLCELRRVLPDSVLIPSCGTRTSRCSRGARTSPST